MASRIKGITVEIGGDTTGLVKALRGVDSQIRTTQSNLKDVNKLLKLDPGNTVLLTQKQKDLETAISLTKTQLDELKEAQAGVQKGTEEWNALQREIIETEQNLQNLEKEYRTFGSVAKQQLQAVGNKLKTVGNKIEGVGQKLSGISGAAAALGGGLLKLGYDAVTSADDLNTLSKQTGLSTDELQKMKYASDLIDVSLEDITGALRKFKGKLDPSNASLAALGVSATNADGSLRDATDVFYDTLSALSKVSNTFKVLHHLHSTPAVESNLSNVETLTQAFNKLFNKPIVDDVPFGRKKIPLPFPYVIRHVIPLYSKIKSIFRDPKVGKNPVLVLIIGRRKD